MAEEVDKNAATAAKDKPPYFRYAFHNIYNYSVLGGFAAASLITQNWWLAICGAGLETLWMVFGPDSRLLRRLWFDKMHEQIERAREQADHKRLLGALPADDQARIARLEETRDTILRLCAENQSLAIDLLKDELAKLGQLTQSFCDLVVASRKYREYMATIDLRQLESGIRQSEAIVQGSADQGRRQLAQKNLAVLKKRQEKLAELRQFVFNAQGQMDLIENTFRLLADQIVTMRSPKELGGQLDELLDGVEAVKVTARETEAMLEGAKA